MNDNVATEWCVCGHGRDAHELAMKPACAVLIHKRHKLTADRCDCSEFKLDTLKYLEELSRE